MPCALAEHSLSPQYLQDSVARSTVLSIYNVATALKDAKLLLRCIKTVRESGTELLVSAAVGELERPALASLLKHLKHVPHSLVFRCIITWGQVRIASRGVDPNRSLLKEEVEEFLPRVSFLAMSTQDFVAHVMPSGVFSPGEDLAILLNMAGYKVNLPQECLGGGGGGGGGEEDSGGGGGGLRYQASSALLNGGQDEGASIKIMREIRRGGARLLHELWAWAWLVTWGRGTRHAHLTKLRAAVVLRRGDWRRRSGMQLLSNSSARSLGNSSYSTAVTLPERLYTRCIPISQGKQSTGVG
ncbi:hypothetical protein O3P69_010365 [Scylla paramamosain]|uniref:Uncharacterized protein n=1 Tax=Scylla paramamosain TaxID=85552 RepID=A0AAW0TSZ7_SCYPA